MELVSISLTAMAGVGMFELVYWPVIIVLGLAGMAHFFCMKSYWKIAGPTSI